MKQKIQKSANTQLIYNAFILMDYDSNFLFSGNMLNHSIHFIIVKMKKKQNGKKNWFIVKLNTVQEIDLSHRMYASLQRNHCSHWNSIHFSNVIHTNVDQNYNNNNKNKQIKMNVVMNRMNR